jgi:hypothetical protein
VAKIDLTSSRFYTAARKIKNELEVTIFTDDDVIVVLLNKTLPLDT